MRYDFVIIGGGILGAATAFQLLERFPRKRVLLLEKEPGPARHQSGHNSGVIHSGIYYKPGSFKARLCTIGRSRMVDFCANHDIPREICGKLVVATTPAELERLDVLFDRGQKNGLTGCRRLSGAEIGEFEPHATGLAALHVPETGIVDYRVVTERLLELAQVRGCCVRLGTRVTSMESASDYKLVRAGEDVYEGHFVINCTGLHCDRTARLDRVDVPCAIAPFRGEYYRLKPDAAHLVRALIYPVPDPAFPFLGVHFTKMIRGGVECGPNAVPAFKREGYGKSDFDIGDTVDLVTYAGFRTLARKYYKMGMSEIYRSLVKAAFTQSLQRLVPAVTSDMLEPAGSGVRAQAITPEGRLVDDFLFEFGDRSLHVLNAPSPAATASLAIAEEIVARVPA